MSKKRSNELEDLATRIRQVIDVGIRALENEMAGLSKGKPDAKKAGKIVGLVKDAATIMGHVRRYDEAQRAAARTLSPAVVIAYLRALSPERRLMILGECGVADEGDEERGSVLS